MKNILIDNLKNWPLFYESTCKIFTKNHLILYYEQPLITRVDINIINNICYILHIWLVKECRGFGLGSQLYDIFVKSAKEYGCKEIRQTPSGKGRKEYLIKRGWIEDNNEVFKRLQ